jgi:ketosteroid isomerase-like protein
MSQEDVEVITRMYEAWNRADMDALADAFDADVVVRPALSTFLSSMTYHGHDGVAQWFAETYEPWAQMWVEPQRFIDAGECTVAIISVRARVSGGHVDVDTQIGHVVTLRDGRIVMLDGYDRPQAALSAVGLAQ